MNPELDGWLRGFRVDLVDSAGRAVPQRMLHHVDLAVRMLLRTPFRPIDRLVPSADIIGSIARSRSGSFPRRADAH